MLYWEISQLPLGMGIYLTHTEVPRGRAAHEIKLWDPPEGRLESAFGCFF